MKQLRKKRHRLEMCEDKLERYANNALSNLEFANYHARTTANMTPQTSGK